LKFQINLKDIFLKSYDNEKHYIACQGPMKQTSQDFWDMIVQYNVPTIVMLTKTDERNPRNPTAATVRFNSS
jgi:protein tyrosine phosphatase